MVKHFAGYLLADLTADGRRLSVLQLCHVHHYR